VGRNKTEVAKSNRFWGDCFANPLQSDFYFTTGEATAAFYSKHTETFPSKNTLQLKIREVRQKMLHSQQPCGDTEEADKLPPTPTEKH